MMLSETSSILNSLASSPFRSSSDSAQATAKTAAPAAPDREEPKSVGLGSLVLTRHLDESIRIGDEIEVQVVGIRSGTVRLKFLAPRSVPIHRREVFEAIRSNPLPPEASAVPRVGKPQGGLVLARSALQSVMIGEDVEVVVVEVRPSTVKLKVTAPRSVSVHRTEVFEAIRAEQG